MDDSLTAQTPQSPVFIFEGLNVLPSYEEDILQQSLEAAGEISSQTPLQNGASQLASLPQPKFSPEIKRPENSTKKAKAHATKRLAGKSTSLPKLPERPRIMAMMNGDPRPIRLTLEPTTSAIQSTTMVQAQPSMVLSNSPVTSGPVTYFIRPALTVANHAIWPSPTVLTTQDNTIPIHHTIDSGIRPVVNIIRPTVVDRGVSLPVNGNLIPTSVLRPVMTTSIVSSNTILKRQPILLPKPTVSGASLSFQNVASTITAGSVGSPNFGQLATQSPTVGGTIKLTKEGSSYICSHPLSQTQVTEIARAVKGTSGDEISSIVYTDASTQKRVTYKIIYPESDEDSDQDQATGTDDENDGGSSNYSLNDIVFTPEEAVKIPFADPSHRDRHDKNGKLISKKRGRPLLDDLERPSKKLEENHAKKLRNDFGFTGPQVLNLKEAIADDSVSVNRENNSQSEESYFVSISQTRAGRITKPPQGLNKSELSMRVFPRPATPEVEEPAVQEVSDLKKRPKRRASVPPRFKCRVCNKIYLGDKKMNSHVKLFPGHGPSHDPNMGGNVNQQLSALSVVPIIPIARTQLEDLVKNLDAELVLDVVSKKMFDNFSMWQLHLKKMILGKEKGLKVIDKLFQDVETVLTEVKKLVDNCLTDTKLCDDPCPSVYMGEYLQLALSGHDGPWYLEKSNHIPEEFHKQLGIEPMIVSPRSDSNVTSDLHHDDDNSNSMMSAASDRDGCPKMVLKMEQNLGTRRRLDDIDDDSQDFGTSLKKFSDGNQIMSPEIHDSDDDSHKDAPENLDKGNQQLESPNTDLNMVISKLNEIQESGVPSPKHMDKNEEAGSPSSELFPRTPLPSFSSIICTTESHESSLSVLTPSMAINSSAPDGDLWIDDVNHHLGLENGRPVVSEENHLKALPAEKIDKEQRESVANSRRSSVDTGTLIIHESLPGSSQPSPTMSRRTSVDHGAILSHVNVDQALHASSSINLLTSETGSQMKISDDMSLPFLGGIDNGQSCSLSGPGPSHPTNSREPLSNILGQTIIPGHYRSVPRSPHIQHNLAPTAEASPIDSLTSFVTKASDERKRGNINDRPHCGPSTSSSSTHPMKVGFCGNRSLPDSSSKPNGDSPKILSCNIQLPPSGISQDSSSSTSHFLSDLESVLAGDSTDFSFADSLKTPEKVFHPMPQQISNQSRKLETMMTPPPVRDPLLSSSVRTDFLGAIVTNELEPRTDGNHGAFQSSIDREGFGDSLFDTSSNSLSSLFNTKEDPSVDP